MSLKHVREVNLTVGREVVGWVLFQQSRNHGRTAILVHVHDWGTDDFVKDIAACTQNEPDGIIVNRPGSAGDIQALDNYLSKVGVSNSCAIVPIIGCDQGSDVSRLIDASPRVAAILRDEYMSLPSQYKLVHDAHNAGISGIDGPFVGHRSSDKLKEEVQMACKAGFDGKCTLRSKEVTLLNSAFEVSTGQIRTAGEILERMLNATGGDHEPNVAVVDGSIRRAIATLHLAARCGKNGDDAIEMLRTRIEELTSAASNTP